jgi:Zn-dependent protease
MLKLVLLLFGALKLGKILTSGGTMLLSLVAYAFIFGWAYAVGFIALLFAHEMGHFLAARRRGLAVGAPTFIPFVGAWIELKDKLPNAETEAYIGLGGPLVGTLASLACYFLARNYDSPVLLAVSYAGFFINLFNLIPLAPLDGGRITAVLGPRVWLAGLPILIAFFLWHPSPILVLIAIIALPQVWKAWRSTSPEAGEGEYYNVGSADKLTYSAYYLVLLVVLALMTFNAHELLTASVARLNDPSGM